MIDKKSHPGEWAAFMYELEDALEHLKALVNEVEQASDYEESDLRTDLGHVYAHLNRAWRRSTGALSEGDREAASRFPDDLTPVG